MVSRVVRVARECLALDLCEIGDCADAGGTAAITDAGMTGPHDSVIGVRAELAIQRMRTRLPVRFEPAEGGVRIEGVVVDCTDDGRAERIDLLRIEL